MQTPAEEIGHIGLDAVMGSSKGYWLMDLFHRCFLLSSHPRFYGDISKECNISIDLNQFCCLKGLGLPAQAPLPISGSSLTPLEPPFTQDPTHSMVSLFPMPWERVPKNPTPCLVLVLSYLLGLFEVGTTRAR